MSLGKIKVWRDGMRYAWNILAPNGSVLAVNFGYESHKEALKAAQRSNDKSITNGADK